MPDHVPDPQQTSTPPNEYVDLGSSPARRHFQCPKCGSVNLPEVRNRISAGGWVVFAVMIVVCFPLFWIGLLMKEDYRSCVDCGYKLS
jgi:predicted RNA-binding Zn-ribbon protein involved in translation (DUF1610 family)